MIVLIDNYDSFSYNLYQMIGNIDRDIKVIRNDVYTVEQIEQMRPDSIIVSPGPGKPCDAGKSEEIIEYFKDKCKILGVCLGHQAICEVFGASINHAKKLMHGKKSKVKLDTECDLFKGLPNEIDVARYHSLAVDKETLSERFKVIACTNDNEIMAVRHKDYEIYGLQFHPESILTKDGEQILKNFLKL